jgi:hypothetical protein
MIVFSLELFSGAETYACKPPISSTLPTGFSSLTLPERQHEHIPTPVDISKRYKLQLLSIFGKIEATESIAVNANIVLLMRCLSKEARSSGISVYPVDVDVVCMTISKPSHRCSNVRGSALIFITLCLFLNC